MKTYKGHQNFILKNQFDMGNGDGVGRTRICGATKMGYTPSPP